MNYNNITNDWDQQLRDAWMDVPAPTDEELNEMIESLRNEFGEADDDGEVRYKGIKYNE